MAPSICLSGWWQVSICEEVPRDCPGGNRCIARGAEFGDRAIHGGFLHKFSFVLYFMIIQDISFCNWNIIHGFVTA